MVRLGEADEFILFSNSFKRNPYLSYTTSALSGNQNTRIKSFRFPHRVLDFMWNYLNFPTIQGLIGKIDVFHTSDWAFPPSDGTKTIATIHDLACFKYPEFYLSETLAVHKRKNKQNISKADMIIAVSENTKNDTVEILNIPEEKIKVIHEAPSDIFKTKPETKFLQQVKNKYGITKRFILYVGTQEPRKNLLSLVEGYHRLDKTLKDEYDLVIAGRKDHPQDMHAALISKVDELGIQNNVIFTGHVAEEEVVALMYEAEMFIFPSLYEGFGLPVLEAMTCGTPVAASNVSSLPEVVGDAGITFNPKKIDSITDAMNQVLTDSKFKAILSEKGKKHAETFSWERAAVKTLDIYKEITKR